MQGMMLHCGSEEVTLDQVKAVPHPEATNSWRPVSYGDAIDFTRDQAMRLLGLEIESEQYGLNKEGNQLFALLTLDTGDAEQGLSIGLRQSYNKSLALGVAIGSQVFVCDNLMFQGSAFKVVRKNTVNVWGDFRNLMFDQLDGAMGQYKALQADTAKMKMDPCSERDGHAILGIAQGEGILTPTQASVAHGDWSKPRHEEFSDRNAWSLYNAVTEGLKKGAPGHIMDRHGRAHDFFANLRTKPFWGSLHDHSVRDVIDVEYEVVK